MIASLLYSLVSILYCVGETWIECCYNECPIERPLMKLWRHQWPILVRDASWDGSTVWKPHLVVELDVQPSFWLVFGLEHSRQSESHVDGAWRFLGETCTFPTREWVCLIEAGCCRDWKKTHYSTLSKLPWTWWCSRLLGVLWRPSWHVVWNPSLPRETTTWPSLLLRWWWFAREDFEHVSKFHCWNPPQNEHDFVGVFVGVRTEH